jgi:hypothetical protein
MGRRADLYRIVFLWSVVLVQALLLLMVLVLVLVLGLDSERMELVANWVSALCAICAAGLFVVGIKKGRR